MLDQENQNTGYGYRRPVQDMNSVAQKPVGYDHYLYDEPGQESIPPDYVSDYPYGNTYPPVQGEPYAGYPGEPYQITGGYQPPQGSPYTQTGPNGPMPGEPYDPYQAGPYQTTGGYQPPQGSPYTQTGPNGPMLGEPYDPYQAEPYQTTGGYQPPQNAAFHQTDPYGQMPGEGWPGIGINGTGFRTGPFDTRDVDPGLKKQRSENVDNRKNKFWKDPRSQEKRKKLRKIARRIAIVMALVLIIAAIVSYTLVFRVKEINVVGNEQIAASVVTDLSGIHKGDSIFAVNQERERAETGINGNRYLIFKDIETSLPSTVTIHVTERHVEAIITYCGMNYAVDKTGMVLEESDIKNIVSRFVIISGVDIAVNGCKVGREFVPIKKEQKLVMQELLLQMRVVSVYDRIKSVNLADLNNILMETRDGYSVRLGNQLNLHAKLKALGSVADVLNIQQKGRGSVDLSDPENPTFIPE